MSGRLEKKNRSIVVVVETIKQKRLESGKWQKNIDFHKKKKTYISLPMSGTIEKK